MPINTTPNLEPGRQLQLLLRTPSITRLFSIKEAGKNSEIGGKDRKSVFELMSMDTTE